MKPAAEASHCGRAAPSDAIRALPDPGLVSETRGDKPGDLSSPEEAQADLHHREGYPNSEIIFDGLAWYPDTDPWWSYPHRIVALRENVQRC